MMIFDIHENDTFIAHFRNTFSIHPRSIFLWLLYDTSNVDPISRIPL